MKAQRPSVFSIQQWVLIRHKISRSCLLSISVATRLAKSLIRLSRRRPITRCNFLLLRHRRLLLRADQRLMAMDRHCRIPCPNRQNHRSMSCSICAIRAPKSLSPIYRLVRNKRRASMLKRLWKRNAPSSIACRLSSHRTGIGHRVSKHAVFPSLATISRASWVQLFCTARSPTCFASAALPLTGNISSISAAIAIFSICWIATV